jgi:amino acid adenylation domain-containing protein
MEKPSTLSPVKRALLEQRWKRASHGFGRRPEIPIRPNRASAPLSFTQRQMWVIDQMTPGNPAYNLPYGFRVRGPLALAPLEDSFNEVIRRHEALRTTFAVKEGEPLQVIHPELKIKINVRALDHWKGEERDNRLQALASEESVTPFELSRLPLIRVSLFSLAEAEHILIINLHHIVADGLSVGRLLNELDTFYRAFTEGGRPRPPELGVQYGDFALWQCRMLANEAAHANQVEFWQKQLGGTLPVVELPADKPRPTFQSFNGSNVFFNIPTGLTQDLRSLGAREGCTFFMTVLAAFQVLLQRYSGGEDIVIGAPVAARTPGELEPLIGLILNMVALRCDLSGNPTFLELLRRSRDTTLNAFSNSDLPFGALMQHLKYERDPSRNPVFQVVLQVLSNTAPKIGELDISNFHFDLKFAQFDLSLHLYEEAGGYQGRFEYCSDLFETQTIRRVCVHFVNLLEAIGREPDRSISALPMFTDAERRQLLVDWNQTSVDYPRDSCIHELFETQARCTPNAVALEYEGRRLTYSELNARANQIARYLARHGVGPEVMVGVCMERSLETVVGILGILKAGGAYVPLDPDYPASRLSFMLEDTVAPVLLTQAKLRDRLPAYAGRTVSLDADWLQLALESQDDLDVNVNARNLAYVIYTSGSTGQPKGTCIEHRSVVRLVKSTNYAELGPQEVFLQFAPISFDASTLELWGSLLNGAKLVVCPAGQLSLQDLGRVIQERGVTTLWLTAALFHQMVDEQIGSLQGVRQLLAGGETLSVSHVRRMLEVIGKNRLINGYGPTESTTFACCHVMTAQSRIEQTVPIGRPIGNTRVYVLDGYMRPVPIGVGGELYIGGDGLAREYLHQPELTAQTFVPDPFSREAGARLYKTGDRVRFRADGCIEFLGRIDHQVKIRGFRIELGEIESALSQHPAVREVVVLAREDVPGDKRLVGYVVAKNPSADLVGELRALLRASLPEYMIPAAFVLLDAFALTHNGKIDRKQLPFPGRSDSEQIAYVGPRTPTEEILAGAWAEVLGLERVGIDDNFFKLGGHSLLATRIIVRVREAFQIDLPMRRLFETPTIAMLAKTIEELILKKIDSLSEEEVRRFAYGAAPAGDRE